MHIECETPYQYCSNFTCIYISLTKTKTKANAHIPNVYLEMCSLVAIKLGGSRKAL